MRTATYIHGLAAMSAMVGGSLQLQGALAYYNFETVPGRTTSSDTDLHSTASAITYNRFTPAYGTGGSGTPPSGDHLNVSMDQTPGSQRSDYFAFTVTANSGYQLYLNTYTLTLESELFIRTGTTGNWALRSSLDNYAANLTTGALPADWGQVGYTFNNASWNNLSSVGFRVYFWDSVNTTDEFIRFDSVTLNGVSGGSGVSAVPEPTTWGMIGFGVVFAGTGAVRAWRSRSVAARIES